MSSRGLRGPPKTPGSASSSPRAKELPSRKAGRGTTPSPPRAKELPVRKAARGASPSPPRVKELPSRTVTAGTNPSSGGAKELFAKKVTGGSTPTPLGAKDLPARKATEGATPEPQGAKDLSARKVTGVATPPIPGAKDLSARKVTQGTVSSSPKANEVPSRKLARGASPSPAQAKDLLEKKVVRSTTPSPPRVKQVSARKSSEGSHPSPPRARGPGRPRKSTTNVKESSTVIKTGLAERPSRWCRVSKENSGALDITASSAESEGSQDSLRDSDNERTRSRGTRRSLAIMADDSGEVELGQSPEGVKLDQTHAPEKLRGRGRPKKIRPSWVGKRTPSNTAESEASQESTDGSEDESEDLKTGSQPSRLSGSAVNEGAVREGEDSKPDQSEDVEKKPRRGRPNKRRSSTIKNTTTEMAARQQSDDDSEEDAVNMETKSMPTRLSLAVAAEDVDDHQLDLSESMKSTGSGETSASIVDVLKNTIAMREALAKERQSWLAGSSQGETSTTTATTSTMAVCPDTEDRESTVTGGDESSWAQTGEGTKESRHGASETKTETRPKRSVGRPAKSESKAVKDPEGKEAPARATRNESQHPTTKSGASDTDTKVEAEMIPQPRRSVGRPRKGEEKTNKDSERIGTARRLSRGTRTSLLQAPGGDSGTEHSTTSEVDEDGKIPVKRRGRPRKSALPTPVEKGTEESDRRKPVNRRKTIEKLAEMRNIADQSDLAGNQLDSTLDTSQTDGMEDGNDAADEADEEVPKKRARGRPKKKLTDPSRAKVAGVVREPGEVDMSDYTLPGGEQETQPGEVQKQQPSLHNQDPSDIDTEDYLSKPEQLSEVENIKDEDNLDINVDETLKAPDAPSETDYMESKRDEPRGYESQPEEPAEYLSSMEIFSSQLEEVDTSQIPGMMSEELPGGDDENRLVFGTEPNEILPEDLALSDQEEGDGQSSTLGSKAEIGQDAESIVSTATEESASQQITKGRPKKKMHWKTKQRLSNAGIMLTDSDAEYKEQISDGKDTPGNKKLHWKTKQRLLKAGISFSDSDMETNKQESDQKDTFANKKMHWKTKQRLSREGIIFTESHVDHTKLGSDDKECTDSKKMHWKTKQKLSKAGINLNNSDLDYQTQASEEKEITNSKKMHWKTKQRLLKARIISDSDVEMKKSASGETEASDIKKMHWRTKERLMKAKVNMNDSDLDRKQERSDGSLITKDRMKISASPSSSFPEVKPDAGCDLDTASERTLPLGDEDSVPSASGVKLNQERESSQIAMAHAEGRRQEDPEAVKEENVEDITTKGVKSEEMNLEEEKLTATTIESTSPEETGHSESGTVTTSDMDSPTKVHIKGMNVKDAGVADQLIMVSHLIRGEREKFCKPEDGMTKMNVPEEKELDIQAIGANKDGSDTRKKCTEAKESSTSGDVIKQDRLKEAVLEGGVNSSSEDHLDLTLEQSSSDSGLLKSGESQNVASKSLEGSEFEINSDSKSNMTEGDLEEINDESHGEVEDIADSQHFDDSQDALHVECHERSGGKRKYTRKYKKRSEIELLADVDGPPSKLAKLRHPPSKNVFQKAVEDAARSVTWEKTLHPVTLPDPEVDMDVVKTEVGKVESTLAGRRMTTRGKKNRFQHLFVKHSKGARLEDDFVSTDSVVDEMEEFDAQTMHVCDIEIKVEPGKIPSRKSWPDKASPVKCATSQAAMTMEEKIAMCQPCKVVLIDFIKILDRLSAQQSGQGASPHAGAQAGSLSPLKSASVALAAHPLASSSPTTSSQAHRSKLLPSSNFESHYLSFAQGKLLNPEPDLYRRTISTATTREPVQKTLTIGNQPVQTVATVPKVRILAESDDDAVDEEEEESQHSTPLSQAQQSSLSTVPPPVATEQKPPTLANTLRTAPRATARKQAVVAKKSQRAERFRCLHCNYTTNTRSVIQEHIYNHTDIIPYSCGHCGAIFGTRSGVIVHTKRDHSGMAHLILKTSDLNEECFYTTVKQFESEHTGVDVGYTMPPMFSPKDSQAGEKSEQVGGATYTVVTQPVNTAGQIPKLTISRNPPPEVKKPVTKSSFRPILPSPVTSIGFLTHFKIGQRARIPPLVPVPDPHKPYLQCKHCTFASTHEQAMEIHSVNHHADERRFVCPQCDMAYCKYEEGMRRHYQKWHPGEPVVLKYEPDYYNVNQMKSEHLEFLGNSKKRKASDAFPTLASSLSREGSPSLSSPTSSPGPNTQPLKSLSAVASAARTTNQKAPPPRGRHKSPLPLILRVPTISSARAKKDPEGERSSGPDRPTQAKRASQANHVDSETSPKSKPLSPPPGTMCREVTSTSEEPTTIQAVTMDTSQNLPSVIEDVIAEEKEDSDMDDGVDGLKIISVCSLADDPSPLAEGLEDRGKDQSGEGDASGSQMIQRTLYSCNFCPLRTTQFDDIIPHINKKHNKEYWWACPYCPFGCASTSVGGRENICKHIQTAHPTQPSQGIHIGIVDQENYFGTHHETMSQAQLEREREKEREQLAQEEQEEANLVIDYTSPEAPSMPAAGSSNQEKSSETKEATAGDDDDVIIVTPEPSRKPHRPVGPVKPILVGQPQVGQMRDLISQGGPERGLDLRASGLMDMPPEPVVIEPQEEPLNFSQPSVPEGVIHNTPTTVFLKAREHAPVGVVSGSVPPPPSQAVRGVRIPPPNVTVCPPPLIPLGAPGVHVERRRHQVPPLQRAPAVEAPAVGASAAARQVVSEAEGQRLMPIPPRQAHTSQPTSAVRPMPQLQPAVPAHSNSPRLTPSPQPDPQQEEAVKRAFSIFNLRPRAPTPPRPPLTAQPRPLGPQLPTMPSSGLHPPPRPPPPHRPPVYSGEDPEGEMVKFKQFQVRPRHLGPRPHAPPPYPNQHPAPHPPQHPAPHTPQHPSQQLGPYPHPGTVPQGSHPGPVPQGPGRHPCPYCPHITPDKDSLSRHLLTHDPNLVHWTCPYCPMRNQMTRTFVEKHISNCHPGQKIMYVPYGV